MRAAFAEAEAQPVRMDNNRRLHRATRVFLASLLISFGASASDVLRQMADELDGLASEMNLDDSRAEPDTGDLPGH